MCALLGAHTRKTRALDTPQCAKCAKSASRDLDEGLCPSSRSGRECEQPQHPLSPHTPSYPTHTHTHTHKAPHTHQGGVVDLPWRRLDRLRGPVRPGAPVLGGSSCGEDPPGPPEGPADPSLVSPGGRTRPVSPILLRYPLRRSRHPDMFSSHSQEESGVPFHCKRYCLLPRTSLWSRTRSTSYSTFPSTNFSGAGAGASLSPSISCRRYRRSFDLWYIVGTPLAVPVSS